MKNTVQRIPFLRLSLALAAGIAVNSRIDLDYRELFIPILLFACSFLVINLYYSYRREVLFGIGIQLAFVLTGMAGYSLYNRKPVFYKEGIFSATVLEIVQEKPNSCQTVLKIDAVLVNDSLLKTSEKVLVYFAKTEEALGLEPGDRIFFEQPPRPMENRNNPYEFDYKTYLSRQKIYRQVYLPANNWVKCATSGRITVTLLAEKTRLSLLRIYQRQNLNERELQVLSALTLGYKRGLDPETKRVFASAGAMHVLAVSGLHAGIVFLVFTTLFGFLKNKRAGKLAFVLLVVLALWSFAFITGLSPSVKRAAAMFTFMVIGEGMKRRINSYNSLAASAFFLLLFNPNNLFEAGFQLSYSAVFGILFLQPRFEKIFRFKWRIFHYMWGLLTVSLSAQIATFPLSALYFNQFPTFFWITNLVVIPAVTLLIPLGILLLLLNWIPAVLTGISFVTGWLLHLMIRFLASIEEVPFSVITLSFSAFEMTLVFALLLLILFFIGTAHNFFFKTGILFFTLLMAVSLIRKVNDLYRREIIVYNYSEQTVIHLISGRKNFIVFERGIAETGMAGSMIDQTVRKMRLHEPIFFAADSSYCDNLFCLNEGLIFFEGKTIALGNYPTDKPGRPGIIIGPFTESDETTALIPDQTIVSTLRYGREAPSQDLQVFFLHENGAFREKW